MTCKMLYADLISTDSQGLTNQMSINLSICLIIIYLLVLFELFNYLNYHLRDQMNLLFLFQNAHHKVIVVML